MPGRVIRSRRSHTPMSEEKRPLLASRSPSRSLSSNNLEVKQTLLKNWDELPLWQQEDCHFIETGYRPASGSLLTSLWSWTYLHNDSVNIFSHLIATVLFATLPFYIYANELPPRYKVATTADLVVCGIYFAGISICFLLSTIFHTVVNHSLRYQQLGMQLDFQGILLLIWGATIPLIYYGFHGDEDLQIAYWTLISALAVMCSIFTFKANFTAPFLRPFRAATFGSFGFASVIPVIHGIFKYGWELQSQRMGLKWMLVTLCLNTMGATAYAAKFPERWFQKIFDIFGASHQILHVMVILAGLTHVFGLLSAFDFLHKDKKHVSDVSFFLNL